MPRWSAKQGLQHRAEEVAPHRRKCRRKCQAFPPGPYLNTNLSLEINRLYDRRGAVWGSRYKGILVSQEEAAQVGRFRYILAHGTKEGLVAQARDWPGVHSVREILAGEPIRGYWFDRTQEYGARNRGPCSWRPFGKLGAIEKWRPDVQAFRS